MEVTAFLTVVAHTNKKVQISQTSRAVMFVYLTLMEPKLNMGRKNDIAEDDVAITISQRIICGGMK